jgi:maltose alpha-D-glucosyltransferase/alpha-amylase
VSEQTPGDPRWYQDAVIYEVHVRAFADSDGDGVGDFPGLTGRLDYLEDLGVTAVWLLPFYPSPLKDDGYDIADYTAVHPNYGTMRDFKAFLREAHRRGIKVITELVINHTSDQHPWFQRARRSPPGSKWRDFYVWSDTPRKYEGTRVIFQDFESSNWTWDPVAQAYYWHRFYSHQPDLNFDSPHVRQAIFKVLDFWLGLGVDGLRLDAVPYLYQREGTNCENLPETYEFLRQLRSRMDGKFSGRMFLAEANQWPEDAVRYFGDGDQCHMAFHFPLMPRMFMALRMEDRFPVIDILEQTPPIPEGCQWAMFLRNHDELTLEMVTDEERDYMYRVYADDPRMRINLGIRRRLAPLLGNHRRRMELMNALLMSLPGTPVLYYGDEIGMGDNIFLGDRNGVRTPMQWSPDRNAGFSQANPQQLYFPVIIDPEYHYETINVETQQRNPTSMLWWMKKLIGLRKQLKPLSRGETSFLWPENPKVLALVRSHGDEHVLVVANLSRFVQPAELELERFQGWVPVEAFGGTEMPEVGEAPYLLTLGPHSFYWFVLRPPQTDQAGTAAGPAEPGQLSLPEGWRAVTGGKAQTALAPVLREYLVSRRWFGGKARKLRAVRISEVLPLTRAAASPCLVMAEVAYTEGTAETYCLPLAFAQGAEAERIRGEHPGEVLAWLAAADSRRSGLVYEAVVEPGFWRALLEALGGARKKGVKGELHGVRTRAYSQVLQRAAAAAEPSVLKVEQSNTSAAYGEELLIKLLRKVEEGPSPDYEIGRALTARGFRHVPELVGALEHRAGKKPPRTLAVAHRYAANQGEAWRLTLDHLSHYFEEVLALAPGRQPPRPGHRSLLELARAEPPAEVSDLAGAYLGQARLLGRRTAQMHLALVMDSDDAAFAPEPLGKLYQRALYQSMRSLTSRVMQTLERKKGGLSGRALGMAEMVLASRQEVLGRLQMLTARPLGGLRTRIHGDYHLGQVLFTGKDFVIIDFEGEPARSVGERRNKRSPLTDVAGMLRSLHYAVSTALIRLKERGLGDSEQEERLRAWARAWLAAASGSFLDDYLQAAGPGGFLPADPEELGLLLDCFLLEKAVYELGYELNNRPDWVRIPLEGLLQILEGRG